VVTEWICCLIFQLWTLPRHACPIVDISHGLFHSRLKTHLFSKSSPQIFFQSFIKKRRVFVDSGILNVPVMQLGTWFLSAVQLIEAYRYGISRDGSAGMIYTRPGKCRYGIPSHTVPLRALHSCHGTLIRNHMRPVEWHIGNALEWPWMSLLLFETFLIPIHRKT